MNFGKAIELLKEGKRVARRGWNGKGIFIKMQIQLMDRGFTMTQPFIYIDTTELETTNPLAPKGRVPWFASQTDMFADDWMVVE